MITVFAKEPSRYLAIYKNLRLAPGTHFLSEHEIEVVGYKMVFHEDGSAEDYVQYKSSPREWVLDRGRFPFREWHELLKEIGAGHLYVDRRQASGR